MNGFIGEMRMFGGNFAPRNWALCNGQLLSIAQNTALFSIIGTIYGGDGRTTFALPDMRGRVPLSAGTGPGLPTYRQGQRSGQEEVTINLLTMPNHTHGINVITPPSVTVGTNGDNATENAGGGNQLGASSALAYNGTAADPGEELGGTFISAPTYTSGLTGANQGHNNIQPYLVLNYVICLQGIFPSRN
ncbi:MAG: tail fiber protein [Bacteroidota bacterium]